MFLLLSTMVRLLSLIRSGLSDAALQANERFNCFHDTQTIDSLARELSVADRQWLGCLRDQFSFKLIGVDSA